MRVSTCHQCEKFFNAEKALSRKADMFCTPKFATEWNTHLFVPTLQEFLENRFLPDAATAHKGKPKIIRCYRSERGKAERV